jgi:hypothetical protein
MYRKFSGNIFCRYVVELAREGPGASQDDIDSTMYIQVRRYEYRPRSRIYLYLIVSISVFARTIISRKLSIKLEIHGCNLVIGTFVYSKYVHICMSIV